MGTEMTKEGTEQTTAALEGLTIKNADTDQRKTGRATIKQFRELTLLLGSSVEKQYPQHHGVL